MARDWRFAPASFNGALFYVEHQEIEEARRIITHEYPGSEDHDNEDLGRNASIFTITAYFCGETTDTDAANLRTLLRLQGPGILLLPMFGAIPVRAQRWRPSWNQQKLNYVGFDITFVEESTQSPSLPIGLGVAQLAASTQSFPALLATAINAALAGEGSTSFAVSDAIDEVATVAAMVGTVTDSAALPAATATSVTLALVDTVGALDSATSANVGASIAALLTQLDTAVTNQQSGDFATTLQTAMASALAQAQSVSSAPLTEPAAAIVPLAAGVAFAAEAVRTLSTATYSSRPDAIAGRTSIAQIAATILDVYSGLGEAVTAAFDAIYGQAAQQISQQIASLKPIVLVEVNVSLPANVLAYRLYGDPTRGEELVARNQVATPCFMPTQFEAASA